MQIKIDSHVHFNPNEIPRQVLARIKTDLTLNNPEYIQAMKYGGYGYTNIEEKITLYRLDPCSENMILPRGYICEFMKHLRTEGIRPEVVNRTLTLPLVDFGSQIELRDYQQPAVEKLVRGIQGGLVAGCGAGKTQVMLEVMARLQQPALWITHTKELLNQVKARAEEVFNNLGPEDVGIIANGKVSIGKKITFALVQTLSKQDLSVIKHQFGAILVDEAHHLAAQTFYQSVDPFPARYRLWCSATPEREDGLTEMVFASGGPVLHTVEACELPTVTPKLNIIETGFNFHSSEYAKLINHCINDPVRNKLIVETVIQEAQGNYSLVLSDRREHLYKLQEMIREAAPDLSVEVLEGSMTKKKRAEIMERMLAKQIDVLLATKLAQEGLDIPHLNRLFLVTPKRAGGALQQEIGRIMRPAEGKADAVIFDFWDVDSPILKSQMWPRRDVYKKLGIVWSLNRIQGAKNKPA